MAGRFKEVLQYYNYHHSHYYYSHYCALTHMATLITRGNSLLVGTQLPAVYLVGVWQALMGAGATQPPRGLQSPVGEHTRVTYNATGAHRLKPA